MTSIELFYSDEHFYECIQYNSIMRIFSTEKHYIQHEVKHTKTLKIDFLFPPPTI